MRNCARALWIGLTLLAMFGVWTALVGSVDVQPIGPGGTEVGFAAWNHRFHALTGVHMSIYLLTDWMGLVPVLCCVGFALLGLGQWLRRKSIAKVDPDLLLLGVYYTAVIGCYLVFEKCPVNYRPILIEGRLEVSYPSSTTLLVMSVMPTAALQVCRRIKNRKMRILLTACVGVFSCFMVVGRLLSGVHWVTDIVGGALLAGGLFCLYYASIK